MGYSIECPICLTGVLVVPAPSADDSVQRQDFRAGGISVGSSVCGYSDFISQPFDRSPRYEHFSCHTVMSATPLNLKSEEVEAIVEVGDFSLFL